MSSVEHINKIIEFYIILTLQEDFVQLIFSHPIAADENEKLWMTKVE
jgi:hypothetical protein